MLQCVEGCCSVVQCGAVWCRVSCERGVQTVTLTTLLQCVVVCCSVLQHVEVCCDVVQFVGECCSVLQCVTMWCSVVQCGAVCLTQEGARL